MTFINFSLECKEETQGMEDELIRVIIHIHREMSQVNSL
jgi:hypothetical protein